MPNINPNSRMRQSRTEIHGWNDGNKFYTSLKPRAENAAKNAHDTMLEALSEANRRHLPIVWENPEEIA